MSAYIISVFRDLLRLRVDFGKTYENKKTSQPLAIIICKEVKGLSSHGTTLIRLLKDALSDTNISFSV